MGNPALRNQHDTRMRSTAVEAADKPAVNVAEPESTGEKVVREATRHNENENVTGARELLVAAGNDPQGLVPYALAETYDPNMLAAWGTRGVAPDLAKAEALYREALDLGNSRARLRLDLLQ
jgi:TPR repeat protein